MNKILRLENVFKDFSGLAVLSGINLEIFEGERHAIIGPNGAGKSTLFNLISGLYKPSKGSIYFLDKNITGRSIKNISRLGISRSFQITNVFPRMTVFENVRSAVISRFRQNFNFMTLLNRSTEITRESDRIIALLALHDLRDVPASKLSYGGQRKLELALSLALDPALIMLDEPTAGLNIEETRNAIQLLRRITEGKTLIIIEHDMEVVFNLADRVTVLNYGGILATGTVDEIRENREVKEAYLRRG